MATLEMAIGTYGSGSQRSGHKGTTDSEVPSLASGEVKKKRPTWYSKLSDKEKMRVSLQRLKKRKDDKGKKMYKSLLAKSKGKDSITEYKRDISKQHIYAARNRARKLGLPLPPLPSENAA
jgi:N-acetylmuramoyl-L-alanine amidase CwlA